MRDSRRGWAPNAPRISIRNGRSGCGAICHAIPPDASASPKSRQWKATRDQPRIRFSSTSQLRRKPIAPLTISLTKRANRFCECWRVFLVKMCSAMGFADTSPLTSIRTPRPQICGTPFRKLPKNPWPRSRPAGRSSPDFQS